MTQKKIHEHIGNGVCATSDRCGITLTNHYQHPTDTIYLRIDALKALNRFAEKCDKLKPCSAGMTGKEIECLDHLVSAWNIFVELEQTHPDDLQEVLQAIHQLQRIIGMRKLRRDTPIFSGLFAETHYS